MRRRFWRIVGKIKRMPSPSQAVVKKAAEIRDILYEQRLGKPKPLGWLAVWFLGGVFCVSVHLWAVTLGPPYIGEFFYDIMVVMSIRGSTVGGAIVAFYPFGRLIIGKITRIRLDGITRDIYFLPTLKINYETYLVAHPPHRQWFFFFAGAWTVITATWLGVLAFLLSGEWIGLAIALILAIAEAFGAIIGGKWAGELGHFKRERRIVRDWRQNLVGT
ncbi:MAG: hypothetical protein ACFFCO_09705 [Promethearchaeota archaeon]